MKVIKCGGSILKDYENRKRLYKELNQEKDNVILVVSAFNDCYYSTSSLRKLLSKNYTYEMEQELIILGEIISSIRVCNELLNEYIDATVLYKDELGIHVKTSDKMDEIDYLDNTFILKKVKEHKVVVVPGFIGINQNNKYVSLNKNGSDLTAIAVAKMCDLSEVYLYKDVLGLSSIDPNISTNYKLYKAVSYDFISQIALHGNELLQLQAIKLAKDSNINIYIIHHINHNYITAISKFSKEKIVVFQLFNDDIYIDGYSYNNIIENMLINKNINYDYILPCASYLKIVTSYNNQNQIITTLHNLYIKGEL